MEEARRELQEGSRDERHWRRGPGGQDGSQGSGLSPPNAGPAPSATLRVPRPFGGTRRCGTPGCARGAPGSLRDSVQPSGCIGPVRGVVKRPPELYSEGRQIRGEQRVAPNRGHGPIQSLVGQGGEDECHLGPVRLEPGGLAVDDNYGTPPGNPDTCRSPQSNAREVAG